MFYNLLLSISVTIHFFFYRCPESPCRMIILNRQAEPVNCLRMCICICCVAEDRAEA